MTPDVEVRHKDVHLNASIVHRVSGPAHRENLAALCSPALWIRFYWPVSATQHQDEGAPSTKPGEVRGVWKESFSHYVLIVYGNNCVLILHLKYVLTSRCQSSLKRAFGDLFAERSAWWQHEMFKASPLLSFTAVMTCRSVWSICVPPCGMRPTMKCWKSSPLCSGLRPCHCRQLVVKVSNRQHGFWAPIVSPML